MQRLPTRVGLWGIVMREVYHPDRAVRYEVLASNGKWREKGEADVLFDDEQHKVEEA